MSRYCQYCAAMLLVLSLRHHSDAVPTCGRTPVVLAAANACPTDCSKECYKKRWGIKYDDPVCRAACEARRAACKNGIKIPAIPGVTDPSVIPPDPREIYYGACAQPFNEITGVVRATCKNYSERMQDAQAISLAKSLLLATGMIRWDDFDGVRIRWCNSLNSEGFAPASNEIYLDAALTRADLPYLAALLLHELQHIKHGAATETRFHASIRKPMSLVGAARIVATDLSVKRMTLKRPSIRASTFRLDPVEQAWAIVNCPVAPRRTGA